MLKEKLIFFAHAYLAPFKNLKVKTLKLKIFRLKLLLKKTKKRQIYLGRKFLVIKGASLLSCFAFFLFFTPTFASNAVFSERVLPEPLKVLQISDQIISERALSFSPPLRGRYISTYFSLRHPGIDIPDPVGTPIKAVAEGKVVFAGYSPAGYGNLVIIEHKDGYSSVYAHLSTISVKKGQEVFEGQILGGVGATGNATGAHLHLEIHAGGRSVNPLNYFSPL